MTQIQDGSLPDVRGMTYREAVDLLAGLGILKVSCKITKPPRQGFPEDLESCRVLRLSVAGDGQVCLLVCPPVSTHRR
ncbi:MAG TPA: hypothetical protein DD727_09190 [Clostridiales bacterium]|nr:hypothetical protein [Clostridiales bacterium]